MALLLVRLQDLLSFFPEDVHQRIERIYEEIPGSLLDYLNVESIKNNVDCRGEQLPVDSSIARHNSFGRTSEERTSRRSPYEYSYSQGAPGSKYNQQPSYGYSTSENDDNKYENALRSHLLRSIKENFNRKNITEVDPIDITDDIIGRCFEKCPDWGRKTCDTTSVNVRFEKNYITRQKSRSLNIAVYSYAYLACERETSRFFGLSEKSPQIKFEVTIELSGLAISTVKIEQFLRMLSEKTTNDITEIIGKTNTVTMENLDQPSTPLSAGADQTLKQKF